MKWLGKLFKKKKKGYNTDTQYKLLIIDDKSDLIHVILGISEERAEVLLQVCLDAYENNNQLHCCLEDVVTACKHTNEVVFATMMMQKVIDRKNSIHNMLGVVKNLFGRG